MENGKERIKREDDYKDMTTQVDTLKTAVQNAPQVISIQKLIEKSVNEIGRALPAGMNPERVVRIALTCISQNPELAKCTPESFIGSLLVLSQLGLEPIAGRSYLLPFNNKKKTGRKLPDGKDEWTTEKTCQAIIGYKGLVELFYRHDSALSIDFQTVCINDRFEYQYGTNPFLNHCPKNGDRGETVGYYAVARLKGNASIFRYMTKEECLAHGKSHSKTFDKSSNDFYSNSPWKNEPDAMCLKTVLIQLSKLLPLSVEMQRAISVDETSRDYREGVTDAMTLPTNAWTEQFPEDEPKKIESKPVSVPGGLI